jgi:hypothetical protein
MISRDFRWGVLAVVLLSACTSGRNEALKPEASEAGTVTPSARDSGVSDEQHREAQPPPAPLVRPDAGTPGRCAPHEMDCCGACIPRSEKRCPENIHCPAALPER